MAGRKSKAAPKPLMGLVAADFHFNPDWVALADISSADYTPPAGRRIHGISFGTAGILKVDTAKATGVPIPSGALASGVQHALEISKIYSNANGSTGLAGVVVYGD